MQTSEKSHPKFRTDGTPNGISDFRDLAQHETVIALSIDAEARQREIPRGYMCVQLSLHSRRTPLSSVSSSDDYDDGSLREKRSENNDGTYFLKIIIV